MTQAWPGVKLAESCGLKTDHPQSNPINNKSVWLEAISCSIKIHRYSVTCSPAPCLCPLLSCSAELFADPSVYSGLFLCLVFFFFIYKLWQFSPALSVYLIPCSRTSTWPMKYWPLTVILSTAAAIYCVLHPTPMDVTHHWIHPVCARSYARTYYNAQLQGPGGSPDTSQILSPWVLL